MISWSEPVRLTGNRYLYSGSDGFVLEEDRTTGSLLVKRHGEHCFETEMVFRQAVFAHVEAMLTPGSVVNHGDNGMQVVVGDADRVLVTVRLGQAALPIEGGKTALLDADDLVRIQRHDCNRAPLKEGDFVATTIAGRSFRLGQLVLGTGRLVTHRDGNGLDARRLNLQMAPLVDSLDDFTIEPNSCWRWQGQAAGNGLALTWERKYAHRLLWERRHGHIARGLLEPSCGLACCVNPDHMVVHDAVPPRHSTRDCARRKR